MFDINLHGSFLFAREAGKYWIKEKIRGNLILVSSMSSMICVRPQKQAAYNAVSALLHHYCSLSLVLYDSAFVVRLKDAE
jgi:NAD(P)-dependent dehydrogenase (short-subunit alcohol dehydrogenase family)